MVELRSAEGYVQVILALSRVEGTSAYLRVLGETYAPTSERDRSDAVLREFLARLYEDMTTFEFDEGRFERAYSEFESAVYEDVVTTTVLAPVLGIQLAEERWELGSGLSLVRGDCCEAPPEAVWTPDRTDGQPNTLICLTVEAAPKDPPPLTDARLAFRKLLTTLRLFKPGAPTLGPSAWWRLDEGPWQSLPLGFTGHTRAGECWLEGPERNELVELFELVRMRPIQGGPLLIVHTDRPRRQFTADIPAILAALDPQNGEAATFEGFYFEARDGKGPFVRTEHVSRGTLEGGQLGSRSQRLPLPARLAQPPDLARMPRLGRHRPGRRAWIILLQRALL